MKKKKILSRHQPVQDMAGRPSLAEDVKRTDIVVAFKIG
jgi:hypothetical protein